MPSLPRKRGIGFSSQTALPTEACSLAIDGAGDGRWMVVFCPRTKQFRGLDAQAKFMIHDFWLQLIDGLGVKRYDGWFTGRLRYGSARHGDTEKPLETKLFRGFGASCSTFTTLRRENL
jgi:hypothetical protein